MPDVKPRGGTFYMASFEGDVSEMAFAAFKNMDNPFAAQEKGFHVEKDNVLSNDTRHVYFLKFETLKIASFTNDITKEKGT